MSRGMIPEDLFRIQWGFDARLSPYGRLVACTVTRNRDTNKKNKRPFTPPPWPRPPQCPRQRSRLAHGPCGAPSTLRQDCRGGPQYGGSRSGHASRHGRG